MRKLIYCKKIKCHEGRRVSPEGKGGSGTECPVWKNSASINSQADLALQILAALILHMLPLKCLDFSWPLAFSPSFSQYIVFKCTSMSLFVTSCAMPVQAVFRNVAPSGELNYKSRHQHPARPLAYWKLSNTSGRGQVEEDCYMPTSTQEHVDGSSFRDSTRYQWH